MKTKPANMDICKRLTTVHATMCFKIHACHVIKKKKMLQKGFFQQCHIARITILDSQVNNSVKKI